MKVLEFDSLGSTNAKATELYQDGERGPLWVRADVQSGGRGRRGRDWHSPKGNLYASALYPWSGTAADAARLSFVVAAALVKTLNAYELTPPPDVKWPNDVLVGGAKISGILLENLGEAVVLGIGVNLVSHPEDTPYPATHMLAHMPPDSLSDPEILSVTPATVLPVLARHIDDYINLYQREGFAPIREAWLAAAKGIPGPVTVNLEGESFGGQAEDLCENGALRVRLKDGSIRNVHAGDIFIGEKSGEHSDAAGH